MGFLGSVGKALGGFVKQVLPSVIQAIAPAASSLLKGVAGDIFQKGAGFLKGALSALPLPSPLKALGEKLLGKGLAKLQDLANGGIDKLISKLADSITKRFAPGAGNIAVPALTDPGRIAQMIANAPAAIASAVGAATGAVGSAAAAATGGASGTSGSSGTGATNASGPSGAGSSDKAPNPENYDMESIKGQAAYNKDMLKFQQALQNMQNYFKSLSDILAGQKDTMNKLSGNLR